MCSTSLIVPVRRAAGIATRRWMDSGSAAVAAPAPAKERNERRVTFTMAAPLLFGTGWSVRWPSRPPASEKPVHLGRTAREA